MSQYHPARFNSEADKQGVITSGPERKRDRKRHYDPRKDFLEGIASNMLYFNERLRSDPAYASVKCLIFPDDPLKMWWDFLMLLLISYSITFVPYKIAFWSGEPEPYMYADYAVDALFFVDIVVTFLSAYLTPGNVLVTNKKTIAATYLKTWFVTDLIACIPFQLFVDSSDNEVASVTKFSKLSRTFRVIKIVRILKFLKSESKLIEFIKKVSSALFGAEKLLYFFCSFIIFWHLLACAWFGLVAYTDTENDWVTAAEVEDVADQQYLVSMYFIITTISTVGYGDILPTNDGERVLCMLIMVLGVFFYSYAIGAISSIMTRSQNKDKMLKRQLDLLNQISKELKLKRPLHDRLKNTLKVLDKKHASYERLLASLPPKVAVQLSCLIHSELIRTNQFFEEKSAGFIQDVTRHLQPLKVKPEEVVYKTRRPCYYSKP